MEARTLINAAIDEASHDVVPLSGGGDIAIDVARAAVVIDVDGGSRKSTGDTERFAQELNLAAAETAARQIALRALGGLVLIDFVGMKQAEGRRALVAKFREMLSLYLGRSSDVLEMSRLGVVEVAVARRGRPLSDALAAGADRAYCTGNSARPRIRWLAGSRRPAGGTCQPGGGSLARP